MPSSSRGNGRKGKATRKMTNPSGTKQKQSGTTVRRAGRAKVQANTSQPARRKPALKKRNTTAKTKAAGASAKKKKRTISDLLSPKNVQESLKTVGSLRTMVKSGLGYLQQADRLLETLYATSNSLKESGVLEKIVKEKGKNLSTEDFTNILMALMSSPVGGQLFKSMGSKDSETADAGEA